MQTDRRPPLYELTQAEAVAKVHRRVGQSLVQTIRGPPVSVEGHTLCEHSVSSGLSDLASYDCVLEK